MEANGARMKLITAYARWLSRRNMMPKNNEEMMPIPDASPSIPSIRLKLLIRARNST